MNEAQHRAWLNYTGWSDDKYSLEYCNAVISGEPPYQQHTDARHLRMFMAGWDACLLDNLELTDTQVTALERNRCQGVLRKKDADTGVILDEPPLGTQDIR
jgi:hypothetical protein